MTENDPFRPSLRRRRPKRSARVCSALSTNGGKMTAIKGGCMCGAVTYEVSGEPMFAGHCACENCQKATGSGHSSIAAFPEVSLKTRGELTSYAAKGDSGQATTYQFCPKCGSRLFIRVATLPDAVLITLGTMEPAATVK